MTNQAYRDVYTQEYDYAQRDKIRNFLLSYVKDKGNYASLGWFYSKIGEKDYLIRMIGDKGTYIMSFVDFNDIPRPNNNKFINNYEVIFRLTDGTVITNQDFVEKNKIEFTDNDQNYYVTGIKGSYILIGSYVPGTNIEMYFVKINQGLLGSLKTIQIVLFVISILSILTIPGSLLRINWIIVKPINKLKVEMEQIKKGNMDTQIETDYELQEFGEINATFNSMISKIKDLKIQYYEQKLEKQKAQMQYLQLQIKPHFYLNCLKNIYGMAQMKKYDKIQELTLIISDHLRYIFKDNDKLVTVNQELVYVRNYLMLQEIGKEHTPICLMDVETKVLEQWIPPLVIQTFVENSIKYGKPSDVQLKIMITAKLLTTDDLDYIDIVISDNGSGYPQDVLEHLQMREINPYSDEQIGINNVINRLKMIYKEKVEYVFMNLENGAYSELIIPVSGDPALVTDENNG
jgi:two-component system sensor histidine kinase YesM